LSDANRHSADALPIRRAPEISRESATQPNSEPAATKILVADDSPDNRLLIAAYLRREPYQLDFAEDGKVAFEKYISHRYDMVFMDVQMPQLDGLSATRMIRKWEKEHGCSQTPVVALSAAALEEDVRRSMEAGCDLHISKPVKKRVLLETIRNLVRLQSVDTPPLLSRSPDDELATDRNALT
jgi:CheY-like chemotaxis protein